MTVCTFPKAKMSTPAFSPLLTGPVAGPSSPRQGFPLTLQRGTVKSNCFCWLWARVTITLNLASARQPWNFSVHEAAVGTGHVQKWLGKVLSIQHSGTPQWIAATLLWGQENKNGNLMPDVLLLVSRSPPPQHQPCEDAFSLREKHGCHKFRSCPF